ncbi:lipopolysaccharide kinase InaA family protein [uncultured Algibacter sp.]|uniref:lipopolysaccharide kinase InaA family protein n=1 Tax=uncultured Algibacter sp. TaxID=298659 RepID=UPI0030EBC548|tara:strand:+ start:1308 stop:2072 length:765 start_codon:yes stop_codon:yes gene_type:complete
MKEFKFFNKTQKLIEDSELSEIIHNFNTYKNGVGTRNVIKIIPINNVELNIKAFKTPNIVNQIVYKYFRKSKARRSFEYANRLLNSGINTPLPIAFFEYTNFLFFKKSFYVSEQFKYDFTIRELTRNNDYPDFENIIRQFTRFTFQLHENQINFLDHSPGNTLIKKIDEDTYDFYLVDLNRMKFMPMIFDDRMKNFAKLSPRDKILEVISNEYAKLYPNKNEKEIRERMHDFSIEFSSKYTNRENFKKKYFFWR